MDLALTRHKKLTNLLSYSHLMLLWNSYIGLIGIVPEISLRTSFLHGLKGFQNLNKLRNLIKCLYFIQVYFLQINFRLGHEITLL